jgi:alpha-L-fucosidase
MSLGRKIGMVSFLAVLLPVGAVFAQVQTLDSLQRKFVDQRFGMFIHFNMNTFHPGWAEARTNPLVFNPTNLNCGQWAKAAKSAGMTYGMLTCKHHDGFAIWPTQTTPPNGLAPYTIRQSSDSLADIVKAYVDSFRSYGLGPGLYFSIWDPNNGVPNPDPSNAIPNPSSAYDSLSAAGLAYIEAQITELLTNYGPIPIFWTDGYGWAQAHRVVPWQAIRDTVKALQPNCLFVETEGMIEPWESDCEFIEETKGSRALWTPSNNTFAAAQAVPIGDNWFWDKTVTSGSTMMSVDTIAVVHLDSLNAHYCTFQLDCPPNEQGLLDTALVNRLAAVGAAWKPNLSRPPLPVQEPMIEQPISPVSVTATSGASTAMNAIDGFNDRLASGDFQSIWTSTGALPQSITLDLGKVYNNVSMLFYLPRRDTTTSGPILTGNILRYKIYVSTDNVTFTQVTSGTDLEGGTFGSWSANRYVKKVRFPVQSAKFVTLEVDSVYGGTAAIIGEVAVGGGTPAAPTLVTPTNGATGLASSVVSWGATNAAVSYGIQVSIGSTFATTVYSQSGLTALSQLAGGVVPNTTYYWRANASGNVAYLGPSLWSSVWSFTTGPTISAVLPQQYAKMATAEMSVANGVLSYSVPVRGTVAITLQDMLGRTSPLLNREQAAGRYTVALKGYNFAAGSYIVRMKAAGFEKTAIVMLTR